MFVLTVEDYYSILIKMIVARWIGVDLTKKSMEC
jgi:hypothetical protein